MNCNPKKIWGVTKDILCIHKVEIPPFSNNKKAIGSIISRELFQTGDPTLR